MEVTRCPKSPSENVRFSRETSSYSCKECHIAGDLGVDKSGFAAQSGGCSL
jgi:hypothetical protein